MTIPSCFGVSWSANAPECAGGLDPTYRHPANGTHKRDRCSWYQQCATRTCATNINTAKTAMPVPAPLNQPPRMLSVQQSSSGQPVQIRPVIPTMPNVPAMYPQQHMLQQQMVPHYQAYYGPQYVPMPYQTPGAQMPAYLTTPEPVCDDVHWFKRLLHEISRAMAKGALHQSSHFVDHMTITKPKPPLE